MTPLLVVLIVLLLLGAVPAWANRAEWGPAPSGVLGLLVTALVIFLLLRLLGAA